MKVGKYELVKLKSLNILLDLFTLNLSAIENYDDDILNVIENEFDETERLQFMDKAKQLHEHRCKTEKISKVCIIPTYNCNFSCQYCYEQHFSLRNEDKLISKEQIERIFDICNKLDKSDDFSIHISGGEPLLIENMDIITYICDIAQREGYKLYITTNGYTLSEYVSLLAKYSALITEIKVSLDGDDSTHPTRRRLKSGEKYSVYRIIEGIKDISKYINVTCNTIIDGQTVEYLPKIIEFIKTELIDTELVSCIRLEGVNKYLSDYKYDIRDDFFEKILSIADTIDSWSKESRQKIQIEGRISTILSKIVDAAVSEEPVVVYPTPSCSSTRQMVFDPYGDTYLCEVLVGVEMGKVGTYYPEFKFNDAYYQYQERTVFTLEKCQSCNYVFLCGGGCPAMALADHGDPFKPDCTNFTGGCKESMFENYLPYLLEKKLKLPGSE